MDLRFAKLQFLVNDINIAIYFNLLYFHGAIVRCYTTSALVLINELIELMTR